GKSFGGRMTSQAQSIGPLENVRGIVFFGFPLHPAGKPGTERADHLAKIEIPMLFLQGTRDPLATLDLLTGVVASLGSLATLVLAGGADHSFHVPAKSKRTDEEVLDELLNAVREWMQTVAERSLTARA
ncbi:MAG: alpha/beta family hydrolase, partial [Thermomicrobiales bacterium]